MYYRTCTKTSDECPPFIAHLPSMMMTGTPVMPIARALSPSCLTSVSSSSDLRKVTACSLSSRMIALRSKNPTNLVFWHDLDLLSEIGKEFDVTNILGLLKVCFEHCEKERNLHVLPADTEGLLTQPVRQI